MLAPHIVFPVSAFHTLRRFPLAGSRTASLRPLPPRRSPWSLHPRRPHSLRGSHRLWPDLRLASPKTHTRMSDDRCALQSLEDARPWTVNRLEKCCCQHPPSATVPCTLSARTDRRFSSPEAPEPLSLPACTSVRAESLLSHTGEPWRVHDAILESTSKTKAAHQLGQEGLPRLFP